MRASGGIETWQIATASASASCDVDGSAESDSSILTMRDNAITVNAKQGYAVWSDAGFVQAGNRLSGRVSMGQ